MRRTRCPVPGGLYEIFTSVTGQHRLMTPTPDVTTLILGVIGRAQRVCTRYGRVRLHAFVFMSGHYHLLLSVDDVRQLSDFMKHLNGNLSYKLNELRKRRGTLWERRFTAIPVTPDEATQRWRLRYLLSHGVKEKLVGKVTDWAGASSLPWLLHGRALKGVWTSFTKRRDCLRRRGQPLDPTAFETVYEIELEVLPCWKRLPPETWRRFVRDMILDIDFVHASERSVTGEELAGLAWVLFQSPWSRSTRRLEKPRSAQKVPVVHAVSNKDRRAWTTCLSRQQQAYREASRAFRQGEWDVVFPAGTFRPDGGFVEQGGPVPLSAIAG